MMDVYIGRMRKKVVCHPTEDLVKLTDNRFFMLTYLLNE